MQSYRTVIFTAILLLASSVGASTVDGYADTTGAGANTSTIRDYIYGMVVHPAQSGTVTHLSFLLSEYGATDSIRFILYKVSDLSVVDSCAPFQLNFEHSQKWVTRPTLGGYELMADTGYVIAAHAKNAGTSLDLYRLTSGGTDSLLWKAYTWDGTIPSYASPTYLTSRKMWCYMNYTPTDSSTLFMIQSQSYLEDTYISNGADTATNYVSDTNYYANDAFTTQDHSIFDIQFDEIPANQNIVACSLLIYTNAGSFDNYIGLHKVKRSVVMSEVDWNEYATGSDWETPGGGGSNDIESAFDSTVAVADGSSAIAKDDGDYVIAIDTAWANSAYSGATSLQVMLRGKSNNFSTLVSSESSLPAMRPAVKVYYKEATGATASPIIIMNGVVE